MSISGTYITGPRINLSIVLSRIGGVMVSMHSSMESGGSWV